MLKKVSGTVVLVVVLAMVLSAISGVGVVTAQAGERIFPAWFFRSHSSDDKELWGNRGIAPGGYFVGGPPVETVVTVETVEEAAVAEEPVSTTHTVIKGECLWYIAGYKDVYGDPTAWPLIYQANKDKIKDPDLIYPGQVLKIPR